MMGSSPPLDLKDLTGALAIAALAADPKGCAERLAALKTGVQALHDAIKIQSATEADLKRREDALSAGVDALAAATAKAAADRKKLDDAIINHDRAHADGMATVKRREAELATREDAMTVMSNALNAREAAMARREAALSDELDAAGKLRAEYEEKLAGFRKLAG